MRGSGGSRAISTVLSISLVASTARAENFSFEFACASGREKDHVGIYLRTESGETLLSAPFALADAPSWSPHGRDVAFAANERVATPGLLQKELFKKQTDFFLSCSDGVDGWTRQA